MLTVPETWKAGLELLVSTKAGLALVTDDELQKVHASVDPTLEAYGQAISPEQINLRRGDLAAPNQACILAHELTHCRDFVEWKLASAKDIKGHMLAQTEINAHFNQGLIARQLALLKPNDPAVSQMIKGNTTFGRLSSCMDRPAVANELKGTPQYGKAVSDLIQSQCLYLWIRDDQWEAIGAEFHCEAHFAKNDYGGFGA